MKIQKTKAKNSKDKNLKKNQKIAKENFTKELYF